MGAYVCCDIAVNLRKCFDETFWMTSRYPNVLSDTCFTVAPAQAPFLATNKSNDQLVWLFLRKLQTGKRVPEDVAVMGFDNLPLADVFEPGLTTIAQPMRELGEVAAALLLERLAGGSPASRTLMHTLMVRDSA